jgi:O-antigen/teichoic acid export membrane protein
VGRIFKEPILSSVGGPLLTETQTDTPGIPAAKAVAVRILRASTVFGLSNLGIRALNFLLLPVYTRFLSPADYGVIALAETLAVLMVTVVGMGFDASIQRLYFHYVGNPEALSSYVGSTLKFAVVVETGFILLVLAAGPWVQHAVFRGSSVAFRYVAITVITAAAVTLFTYRLVLYQAERRPWPYAVLSFLSFALTASFSIALVVFAGRGIIGMLVGKLIAALLCLAVGIVLTRHALHSHFHWAFVRETMAMGVPLVPHLLMALGLITADRFILAHYSDLREVGLYAIAYSLGMIMSLVTMSLNQAWAPVYYDVARQGEEGRQVLGKMCSGLIIALTAVACFGALIAQGFVARFIDHRYVSAGRVVPWIIGAYLAHSLFTLFSLAPMQAKRTKLIMGGSFVALVVNTALNFALIPHWGMYGAAYATLIAYVVEAMVMYVLAQRAYRLQYDLPRIVAAMAVFGGALVVTQVRWNIEHVWISTVIAGVICLVLLVALGLNRITLLLRPKPGAAP